MSFIFEKRDNSIEFFRSPSINFKPHLHEHIEFVYIVSGKCDLYVDDKYYSLKKGDISVVFPNQIHGYENSIDLDAYVLIFSSDILYEFKELCYNKIPSSPILKNGNELILNLLCLYFDNKPTLPFESQRGIILSIFGLAFENVNFIDQDKYTFSVLKNILIFCNNHFHEQITIQDVADNLHISRSHIAHIFRNKLRTSFSEYLNIKRITLACNLLNNSNLPITEIAYSTGFSSIRTFNRTFAKLKGCNPRQYRNDYEARSSNSPLSHQNKM